MKSKLKVVFVGHVDHGKSTLIGRILIDTKSLPDGKLDEIKKLCADAGKELEISFLMDFLQEEREQNITIDTSQIFFKTKKRDYVIIDAPGHREFTKNMITGASQADAAVLLVDAEEGIMEQTKRHAYILSMLGLKQVVVVLNKMDKINYDENTFNSIASNVKEFLLEINIVPEHIIPISARDGDNVLNKSTHMTWCVGSTLLEALDNFKSFEEKENAPLRFPVQDVYFIDNKRIIVGRVESGTMSKNQEIIILPGEEKTTINSIEEFMREKKKSFRGESTGIITKDKLFIERGNVISDVDDKPTVTKILNANIFWMSKQPLKTEDKFLIRCATQETNATLKKINKVINSSTFEISKNDAELLQNMEVGDVVIECDKEIIIDDFNKVSELGRFVIERYFDTVGGGIVTNK